MYYLSLAMQIKCDGKASLLIRTVNGKERIGNRSSKAVDEGLFIVGRAIPPPKLWAGDKHLVCSWLKVALFWLEKDTQPYILLGSLMD